MGGLRRAAGLREVAQFDVQFYLDLQFVDDRAASELETLNAANDNVIQFCNAVQSQITGSIVESTAAFYNATIIGVGGLDCIRGSTRVYDPEAVDIFGDGFFSLQIHVSQSVVVESTNLLWLELVEAIIETGFTKVAGGGVEFRSRLQSNPIFDTIISIETRSGLAAPAIPPTRAPSRSPSSTPSIGLSSQPSSDMSDGPSYVPTRMPSVYPSQTPSLLPSAVPTAQSSGYPSLQPSIQGSSIPTTMQNTTSNPSLHRKFDTPVIRAIVGATVMLLTSVVFALLLLFRCRSKRKKRLPYPSEIALSKRDAHGRHVIPVLVELGDDHLSLAETSLGEHTAGGIQDPNKRGFSRKSIRPLGSFDENSLYTTPYSIKPDGDESPSPQLRRTYLQVTPSIDWKMEVDDLPTLLDSREPSRNNAMGPINLTRETYQVSNKTGGAIRYSSSSSTRRSIPVDVDSASPFYDDGLRITKIEPLGKGLTTVEESDAFSKGMNSDFDDEFTRDASELDVWSCDFDDFDNGSESDLEETTSRTRILGSIDNSESSFDARETSMATTHPKERAPSSTGEARKEPSSFHQSIKEAGQRILGDLLKTSDPPPAPTPTQSPSSTESSKTSNSSFSSCKAYTGTQQYRLDPSIRHSKILSGRQTTRPMAQLLDSLSIPTATPEGNESDLSDILNDVNDSRDSTETNDQNHVFEPDDDDSGMSPSPWLMEETEKILGPRSMNADTESLSGKSTRSLHSKTTRGRKNGSETSFGSASRFSVHQISSVMSAVSSSMSADILEQTGGEISVKASRETLRSDKKRLEAQLAHIAAMENDLATTTSSVTLTTIPGASLSTLSHQSKLKRKKRIIVLAPPGKLGVILANRHDGKGTIVAELRPDSPLEGMLSPGDKLVAVDNRNVEHLECSQITSLIAARAGHDRRLTVITSAA